MFDFLRDFGKSEEEKRQEALTAYLDNALTPAEKERFERHLASDEALRASLEEQRLIQSTLHRLPRMRAPRNFTLDPALYGRPVPSTVERLYPIMRTATAVVAVLFVFVLVLNFLPIGAESNEVGQPLAFSTELHSEENAAAAAAEAPAEEAPEAVLVERSEVVVTREIELMVEEPVEEMAEEEAAQEPEPAVEAETAGDALPGEGSPIEEPPAEEAAVEEPAMAEEGLAAAPEADSAGVQGTEAMPRPQATTGGDRALELATRTPLAQEAPVVADEIAASQAAPVQATSPAAPESDDLVADGAAVGAPSPRAESRLTSTQLAAILLGLGLVILLVVTLLLRRRSQRLS